MHILQSLSVSETGWLSSQFTQHPPLVIWVFQELQTDVRMQEEATKIKCVFAANQLKAVTNSNETKQKNRHWFHCGGCRQTSPEVADGSAQMAKTSVVRKVQSD